MIKCIDKHCPYFEKITLQIRNREIEQDCVKGFHPEGYCERLQAFCDTRIQGEDCR